MKTKKFEVAEIKLTYVTISEEKPKITSSKDAYEILLGVFDETRIELCEEFHCLYLNRMNCVIGHLPLSVGGLFATIADVRFIIVAALLQNAHGLLVSHNHPSGNLSPSEQDKKLTEQIFQACKWHEIVFLDHMIMTKSGYYSFADEGILPTR